MFELSSIRYAAMCVIGSGLFAVGRPVERHEPATPAVSASRIVFASQRDGNWEIYVSDPDGRNQVRLTRSEPQDRFPMWSPDQSQIAFGSQVSGDHWELWVMNADGSKPRELASEIVAKGHRQWSPDGKRIVFAATAETNVDVFSVEVASGKVTRLTTTPGEDRDPAWSPDGSRIAFSSVRDGNAEIYTMRADGTGARRLTSNAEADESPAWAPSGASIAFVSGQSGARDIYMVAADGGRAERLTTGAKATRDALRWSPDGSHLAVQTNPASYDIEVVRMADRARSTVAGSAAYDGQFSWSPAGDQLAFISARDGPEGLYVTDLKGKATRITMTSSLNPGWSP